VIDFRAQLFILPNVHFHDSAWLTGGAQVAIDPSVAELAVEAEVMLLPTGQLLCAADDPVAKSHTRAEFVPADLGEWSVPRRMRSVMFPCVFREYFVVSFLV
jgi:hypothetical protein